MRNWTIELLTYHTVVKQHASLSLDRTPHSRQRVRRLVSVSLWQMIRRALTRWSAFRYWEYDDYASSHWFTTQQVHRKRMLRIWFRLPSHHWDTLSLAIPKDRLDIVTSAVMWYASDTLNFLELIPRAEVDKTFTYLRRPISVTHATLNYRYSKLQANVTHQTYRDTRWVMKQNAIGQYRQNYTFLRIVVKTYEYTSWTSYRLLLSIHTTQH
jgi:hypothetical protein